MPKFRKRPVIIEAFQMTKARGNDNNDWPAWLHKAWNTNHLEAGSLFIKSHEPRQFAIQTLEGARDVTWGDFIIQGVKGELYPCKPDIFAATYEVVPCPPRTQ
jgi:hypothetical protein